MNSILRNILVFIGAAMLGGFVNYSIVNFGFEMMSTPEGFDFEKPETFSLLTTANLMLPFVAHALGTLVAAFLVAKFAASHWRNLAFGMGFFFLMGGAAAVAMIKAPMWFNVMDLVLAYFPMAFLGWVFAGKK